MSCIKEVDPDDYKFKMNELKNEKNNRHGYEYFHNIKACTVHMLCIVCFVE